MCSGASIERSLGAGFDPREVFSPEDVAAHWQQICDFEGAAHPKDNIQALKEMTGNLQKFWIEEGSHPPMAMVGGYFFITIRSVCLSRK